MQVLSPHGMYFPGTTERLAAVEGSEEAVFHVLDWIIDKLTDPKVQLAQQQQQQSKTGILEPTARPPIFRVCVPRAVVGSLIGKNGGYIQSLRVATGATINISPLFVNAEEACAERVVSVESRKKHSLRTAAFTLIRKINAHPDKATCKHVCYYRRFSFDSPMTEAEQCLLPPLQQQLHAAQSLQGEDQAKRTVSMVLGPSPSGNSSSALPSSAETGPAGDPFAAFRKFCEARQASDSSRGGSSTVSPPGSEKLRSRSEGQVTGTTTPPQTGAGEAGVPDSPLKERMQEVAIEAVAKRQSLYNTRESLSTLCPSSGGSFEKLPTVGSELPASRTEVLEEVEEKPLVKESPPSPPNRTREQLQQWLLLFTATSVAFLVALLWRSS